MEDLFKAVKFIQTQMIQLQLIRLRTFFVVTPPPFLSQLPDSCHLLSKYDVVLVMTPRNTIKITFAVK